MRDPNDPDPKTGRPSLPDPAIEIGQMPAQPDSDIKIARTKAQDLKIPFVDPLRADVEPAAVRLLSPEMAIRRQALPIRVVDGFLLVAMLKPEEPVEVKSLELLTGLKIRPAIAPKHALFDALKKYYANGYDKNPLVETSTRPTKTTRRTVAAIEIEREKAPCTVSVISNKGGVGKTHLSINLAYSLAKKGAKVLLVDADLGNADVSNKLKIFPKYHLVDFLAKRRQMAELICRTQYGFDLIASSYGEFELANLYHAQKIKFIRHFKKIGQRYEFVIFDLGAGISRTVMDFALAADHTIVVTTPQDIISGYACARAIFSRFKEIEDGLENKFSDYDPCLLFSPIMAINQVTHLRQGQKIFQALTKAGNTKINSREAKYRLKFDYLGAIPYDPAALRAAELKKRPLLEVSPDAKPAQSIHHMSSRFLNPEMNYLPKVRFKNPMGRFAAILGRIF